MMKKLLYIVLCFMLFLPASSFASFTSEYTRVSGAQNFAKKSGAENILKVSENTTINPFKDYQIVKLTTNCSGNACGSSNSIQYYLVKNGILIPGIGAYNRNSVIQSQGELFNYRHPFYRTANSVLRTETISEKDRKIQVITTVFENTYIIENGVPKPNQRVRANKKYDVFYDYDTTPPTCGNVTYYKDRALTTEYKPISDIWISENVFYTLTCQDKETGCKQTSGTQLLNGNVISSPEVISHLSDIKATFTNNVDLNGTCTIKSGEGVAKKIFFDKVKPRVEVKLGSDVINIYDGRGFKKDPNNTYTKRTPISQKAGSGVTMDVNLSDIFTQGSKSGVSGIQSYVIKLVRLSTNNFDPKAAEVVLKDEKQFDDYNQTGTVEQSDIKPVIKFRQDKITQAGKYQIELYVADHAGNEVKVIIPLHVYPEAVSPAKSSIVLDESVRQRKSASANAEDYYKYNITLKDQFDNPIGSFNGKTLYISSVEQNISTYTGEKSIYLDDIIKTGPSALTTSLTSNGELDKNGKSSFTLISHTPGIYSEIFDVNIKDWNDKYFQRGSVKVSNIYSDGKNGFQNLLWGRFNGVSTDDSTGKGNELVQIGKEKYYGIEVFKNSSAPVFTSSYIKGAIVNPAKGHVGHFWTGGVVDNYVNKLGKKNFNTPVDKQTAIQGEVRSNADGALKYPQIVLERIGVSYVLKGKRTSYIFNANGTLGCLYKVDCDPNSGLKDPISDGVSCYGSLCGIVPPNGYPGSNNGSGNNGGNGNNGGSGNNSNGDQTGAVGGYSPKVTDVNACTRKTLGLRVTGALQGTGSTKSAGEGQNYTDISASTLRSQIRKNALTLVRGLKDGQKVDGVLYKKGNVSYKEVKPELLAGGTLIIENGNFIIDGNIESRGGKLGVIVLSDSYNVENDPAKTRGNIYVASNVKTIKAFVYADGAFMSADSNGNKYDDKDLGKEKLTFRGSLFTRNTIGGGLVVNEDGDMKTCSENDTCNFILPGGKTTQKEELAKKYDLNFVRLMDTQECSENTAGSLDDQYSLWIRYDASFKNNPPKGFEN